MSAFGPIQFTAATGYGVESGETAARLLAFKDNFREDFYSASAELNIDDTLVMLIEMFRTMIPACRIDFITPYMAVLGSERVHMLVVDQNTRDNPWAKAKRNIKITAHGDAKLVQDIAAKAKTFPKIMNPRVVWNYLAEGKRNESVVFLDERREPLDVFYPYIEGGLTKYFNDFMESSAAILLLRGEPGTGKTSFINSLIWQKNLDTMITYEEALFKSDQMFVDFLTNRRTDLLIMEDADALIMSRERHGNETMSKFLNISDGLVRFKRKKIIISSNVIDEDRIDSALLRRGRCFGAPVFRRLTFAEANIAAEAANKQPLVEDREYSLAEILNGPGKQREVRRVGFMGQQALA